MPTSLRAVVFDFDGLVLDTESAILRAWQEEYERHGVEFPSEHFIRANVGTIRGQADYADEYDELERLIGGRVDRDAIVERRVARHEELLADVPPNPGVIDWLDAADEAGLTRGVASSSSRDWVEPHLERLGLRRRFDHVSTRTDVGDRAKPDPAVYLHALEHLGVDAAEAVALEDSPAGVKAAKGAGIFTVAVPSHVTRILDFTSGPLVADLVVDSLAAFTLADLLERLQGV